MPSIRSGVIDITAKKMFLDTKLVEGLIGKKNAKALRIAMSRVRLRAMHSMKRKGKARRPPKSGKGKAFERWAEEIQNAPVAPAGSPPFAHSDDSVRSLRAIWFALDTSGGNFDGIVGPRKLHGGRGSVPKLLEGGGSQRIDEVLLANYKFDGKRRYVASSEWVRANTFKSRNRAGMKKRVRTARYAPHPFMQPALAKEAPRFPSLWTGSTS
jgi:hypothetical protein